MLQIGPLVEVALKRACEKTPLGTLHVGHITLLGEDVLSMYDAVRGQDSHGLGPCGVHGLVFAFRQSEKLRKLHAVGEGNVPVFGEEAVVFYCQQRKLSLECRGFQRVSHCLVSC